MKSLAQGNIPKLSLLVRTDLSYIAHQQVEDHAAVGAHLFSFDSQKNVLENLQFSLSDAKLSLTGQSDDVYGYALDLDFVAAERALSRSSRPRAASPSFMGSLVKEAWVERLVLPFSVKAGRMWVRAGSFENDAPPGDVHSSSLLQGFSPASTLTGFEFGLLTSRTHLFVQIFEPADGQLKTTSENLSAAAAMMGEYLDGLFSPMLSAGVFAVRRGSQNALYDVNVNAEEGAEPAANLTDADFKKASWIAQFGAGLQMKIDGLLFALEYGRMHRNAGSGGYVSPQSSIFKNPLHHVSENSLYTKVAQSEQSALLQNVFFRADLNLGSLRPLVEICYDFIELQGTFLGRSMCAATGLEYFPRGSQYRTHLVFLAKEESTQSQGKIQARGGLFGVRFLL